MAEAIRIQVGETPAQVPPVLKRLTIEVRSIALLADIGVLDHEIGEPQTLLVSVTLEVEAPCSDEIEDAVNYTRIVDRAVALAAQRIGLIETFALRLAEECLADSLVQEADVMVEKPAALSNGNARARAVLRRAR